jgi:ketosteroid isomerase-like protein
MSTENTKPDSGDEEAARKVVYGFQQAWNRHDMDAFGALFAPDADFVNRSGVHWKGREAIQLNHAFVHGTVPIDSPGVTHPKENYGVFKTVTIAFKQIDVRFIRTDVAVAHVISEPHGDPRREGQQAVVVMILTRNSGHWLITVGQTTEINRSPELK